MNNQIQKTFKLYKMSFPILDKYKEQFSSKATLLDTFQGLFNQKLWHQLTQAVMEFIYDGSVKGKLSFDFYTEFVKKFSRSIDQINHLKIIKESLASVNSEEAIKFLQSFEEKQAFTDQTKTIVAGLRASYYVDTDIEKCSELYHRLQKFLKEHREVDAFAYSTFYRFAMNYYFQKSKQKLFYDNALQYLAYTQAEEIEEKLKVSLLAKMGIALLASSEIYNFSELMEQPMLKSLSNSEYKWIYQLLVIFNTGDIETYDNVIDNAISRDTKLKDTRKSLDQKIRLMAFLETSFNLPKNNRVITFNQLSKICAIPLDHVEFMVMKAASLDLVKVQINQLAEEITVSWVKPKVLSTDRIAVMLNKYQQWEGGVEGIREYIVKNRKIAA